MSDISASNLILRPHRQRITSSSTATSESKSFSGIPTNARVLFLTVRNTVTNGTKTLVIPAVGGNQGTLTYETPVMNAVRAGGIADSRTWRFRHRFWITRHTGAGGGNTGWRNGNWSSTSSAYPSAQIWVRSVTANWGSGGGSVNTGGANPGVSMSPPARGTTGVIRLRDSIRFSRGGQFLNDFSFSVDMNNESGMINSAANQNGWRVSNNNGLRVTGGFHSSHQWNEARWDVNPYLEVELMGGNLTNNPETRTNIDYHVGSLTDVTYNRTTGTLTFNRTNVRIQSGWNTNTANTNNLFEYILEVPY